MKQAVQAVPRELDREEMLDVIGGGDPGTSIFHDIGYVVGYVVGCVANAVDFATSNPPANYAYGKVGYSS